MLSKMLKNFLLIILIYLINKQAFAITGEEISSKVSNWLIKEGVSGIPVFSKNASFNDCKNGIEITKLFKTYKTVKVNCLYKNGFELIMRVQLSKKLVIKKKFKTIKLSKVPIEKNEQIKKNKIYKIIKLKN